MTIYKKNNNSKLNFFSILNKKIHVGHSNFYKLIEKLVNSVIFFFFLKINIYKLLTEL